jgi:hypothetical protein
MMGEILLLCHSRGQSTSGTPDMHQACWLFLSGPTQEGDFYGGWITSEIVEPFEGGAGMFGR